MEKLVTVELLKDGKNLMAKIINQDGRNSLVKTENFEDLIEQIVLELQDKYTT